jgi:hypothetical protein
VEGDFDMKDLIFAFLLGTGEAEKDALRLARSIRTFGGAFCFNPIWIFSQVEEGNLSEDTRQALFSTGARLITIDIDPQLENFPFFTYVSVAGIAESMAQGDARFLALMATDTLVLQEPSLFVLADGKSLGACPVHLKLLGSGMDEPMADFWKLIYRGCQVDTEKIFAFKTIVDEKLIRAYFNAGLLIVRPERGLLRNWQTNFERMYRLPEFKAFYQQSELYPIFMHQAVLAGSILTALHQQEFQQFPFEVNYPLHLHERVRRECRPKNLNQLITCRYEDFEEFLGSLHLDEIIGEDESLKQWLQAQSD